jgi:glycosyltransferase involved in cell wall biosynthesis
VLEWRSPGGKGTSVSRLSSWLKFVRYVRSQVAQRRPDLIVTIMLHPLAALPRLWSGGQRRPVLVSCVYDIPSGPDLGLIDRLFVRAGWARLRDADVVWSSDEFKAELAKRDARLSSRPIVCHNCPRADWLDPVGQERDPWLRSELRARGASLPARGGCIVLRAGAVGEHCGVEETLRAMRDLPDDLVFLLMGRPSATYKERVLGLIRGLGLEQRAFLWDRPSDEVWAQALRGADVGHLVHGPYSDGAAARAYALNSSLSNNRLFQYFAAGLPIVTHEDVRMRALCREVPCFELVSHARLVDDLRRALEILYRDPSRRWAMGCSGRNAHLSRYQWDRQFDPVIAAIRAAAVRIDERSEPSPATADEGL